MRETRSEIENHFSPLRTDFLIEWGLFVEPVRKVDFQSESELNFGNSISLVFELFVMELNANKNVNLIEWHIFAMLNWKLKI